MLGIVFTEFIECVEARHGMSVADKVQSGCPFQTGFTAVGNYDHHQLLTMVTRLQEQSGIPVPELVRRFGQHIFHSFLSSRPEAFEDVCSTPQLLRKVQDSIHLEVLSLYPNAELPQFSFPESGPDEFRMEYRSSRPFADLAHGILEASVKYFEERWQITRQDLNGIPGTHALFVLSYPTG